MSIWNLETPYKRRHVPKPWSKGTEPDSDEILIEMVKLLKEKDISKGLEWREYK